METQAKPALNRPNPAPLPLDPSRPVHFIGVGGVGMSALAKILIAQDFKVSGSDAKESSYLTMLRELGANVTAGHAASQLPANAIVVANSAIREDNPEIQAARSQGLEIYHRSDLLREILNRFECAIGLTGTHGKTTMTGMTGLVLQAGGLNPTILAGGTIPGLGTNAVAGPDRKYAVAELDESDGTVVQYHPKISVIANLELDHPDHYQSGLEAVKDVFRQYLNALDRDAVVFFNMDDPVVAELARQSEGRVRAIGIYPRAEQPDVDGYTVVNVALHVQGGYQADVMYQGDIVGSLWLHVPGRYNLDNALCAFAVGHHLGISADVIRRTLEDFDGMGRRFEILGKVNGAQIVDDYAHHPTEVRAALRAARERNAAGGGRVIALFQPHRYQRLSALWDDFCEAFEDADELIVTDVYAAGDAPIAGIDGPRFAHAVQHAAADYWPSNGGDWSLVLARLKTILTPGDLLITLGAGDVTRVGRDLVAQA